MMERKITPPLNLWGGEGARVPALPDGAGERVAVERGRPAEMLQAVYLMK